MYVHWSPVTNPSLTPTNDQRATWLQSTLVISGSAGQQKSGLFGATGSFFQENTGTIAFGGGVVGVARSSATGDTTRVGSGIASAQIQTNTGLGNAIYGPQGEFIVAVPDTLNGAPNTASVRTPAQQVAVPFNQAGQTLDGNLFVNVLQQNAANSAPTQAANAVAGTDQALLGFTAGILDSRASNGTVTNGAATFNGAISIGTASANNRVMAAFGFTDSNSNNYLLNFGSNTGFNDGRSSFINNQIFAARDGVDNSGNPTSTINGRTAAFSRTFMISSGAVPIDFQTFAGAGVTACTCSFMQWGWWIGEVRSGTGQSAQRFSLSTWVAGTPAQAAEIQNLTGTATFNGHYIANVSSSAGNYIAAGNYAQNWNFASRSGSAQISNFDRGGPLGTINASGTLVGSGNAFGGTISGSGLSGSVNGLFYKNVNTGDPSAGVGGTAGLSNANYRAMGTFAACKVGTGC
jgi:hypothetical protein